MIGGRLPAAVAGVVTASLLGLVSCSGGDPIIESGNEATTTVVADSAGSATTSADAGGGTAGATGTGDVAATTAPTTAAPTTTTTPLANLPDCPVDALPDDPAEPIEIVMWHGLTVQSEAMLATLADQYNASQSRVRVRLEGQGNYDSTIDSYFQSGQSNRPDIVMFPEYVVQRTIDSESVIPIQACVEASGYDLSEFQPSTITAYTTAGVQWAMPFNVSNPVLYYNRRMFEAAGLDPDAPPRSLEELRSYSQAIVDSGAAAYGLVVDSGSDRGGGWFIEQWLANAGELYANNGNGRLAPATEVLFDRPAGVELLTFIQDLVNDGLAYYVGDGENGEGLYKLADPAEPGAMTLATSALLSTVLNAVEGGQIPGMEGDDLGVGPLPGPSGTPTALVGGASLYIVDEHGDDKAAAAWDFITYLVSPEAQSQVGVLTGYVPVRGDALVLDPVATVYEQDPRFRVAYDQLVGTPDEPALQGPILGPQREIRVAVARAAATIMGGDADVQTALTEAAQQANALLREYNARN